MYRKRPLALLSRFMSASLIFYALSGIASLLHYGFYPAVSRFISTGDYGQVQFLASMFAQLAIVSVILNILAVIISVQQKDRQLQQAMIDSLNRIAQTFTIIVAVVGTAALLVFQDHLSLGGPLPVLFIGLALVANVPFTIIIGQLQGNGRFISSGIVNVAAAALKLLFAATAAVLGYGTAGIIASIFLSLVFSWVIGVILMHGFSESVQHGRALGSFLKKRDFRKIQLVHTYAVGASISILTLTVLSTMDSVLSRVFLTNEAAGHYASVATVSKIILSVATPIMWLALPPAVEKRFSHIARLTAIVAGAAALVSLLLVLFPGFFTTTLIGVDPKEFLSYIIITTSSMATYAISYLTLSSLVCMGDNRHAALISVSGIALFGLLVGLLPIHSIFERSLYAQLCAGIFIMVMSAVAVYRRHRQHHMTTVIAG